MSTNESITSVFKEHYLLSIALVMFSSHGSYSLPKTNLSHFFFFITDIGVLAIVAMTHKHCHQTYLQYQYWYRCLIFYNLYTNTDLHMVD